MPLGAERSMSRSKTKFKPRKFTAAGEARRRARELAGSPPAARVIPDKRLKPPKHKKKLVEESVG
jgi:hypothetical protein